MGVRSHDDRRAGRESFKALEVLRVMPGKRAVSTDHPVFIHGNDRGADWSCGGSCHPLDRNFELQSGVGLIVMQAKSIQQGFGVRFKQRGHIVERFDLIADLESG